MLANEIINILLPSLSHWIVWLSFLIAIILILLLYAYPYIKSEKEFHYQYINTLIVSIISLYIFTKILESVIYQGSILKIDAWFNSISYSPWITSIALFITNFGSTTIISLLFIIVIALLFIKKRWRYALLSAIALGGASLLQFIIKELVHRTRPVNLIETSFSFPSGHAIIALVFVSLLIYSFKDDFKNLTARYVLIIIFSAFFISVGISRIILHVHWFSDVIAGMSLGLFWFMFLILIEISIPGIAPAIKTETKKAKSIVPKN